MRRTVQVVHVRVEAAGVLHARVEPVLAELLEAGPPEVQAAGHDLDVPLPQRIVHHVLILLHLQPGQRLSQSKTREIASFAGRYDLSA